MPHTDPRVDAYIAKSADFAKPILTRVRKIVHQACPDCEETIKWGQPTFVYKGIVCGMAAFKQHCVVHFWKGGLIAAETGGKSREAMGELGRLTWVKDLPPDAELARYVKMAVAYNEAGKQVPKAAKKAKPAPKATGDFASALKKNNKALATFDAFPPSHQRDYVEWIAEAKREETRQRRIAQAIEWLAEGKPRNWKYM